LLEKSSNALVTLVAAKENGFQEPFETVKTVLISTFVWQHLTAVRADKCWISCHRNPVM